MILRSYTDYNVFAKVDLKNHTLRSIDYDNLEEKGLYAYLGDNLVFFYRLNDNLYLSIDYDNILIDDRVEILLLKKKESQYVLSVKILDQILYNIEYSFIKEKYFFEDDTTGFIEEEDFNFGLFLRNVVMNNERKRLIFPTVRDL
ncbi:hypothetical protein QQ008_27865 [Fulvivirgaceae bacterium BMA10]|uniref:Uncharacterized protein n=1 Tax=Splendidivirga corallicola TaxID=3051826 RepID=A0ABT8KZ70_9BACT|nr:hypothetical protein [Fulvivirgaceae bacterium BMA10]